MANIIREALNADAMRLTLFCAGQSYVGFNLTGTWVGTISFYGSFDGVNFVPISVTPFASGTAVSSATANGSWYAAAQNYAAVQVRFTRTSGTVLASLSASNDSSFQDVFLASTSIFVTQSVGSGAANSMTIAASTNRAWSLKKLVIGFSVAPAAGVLVTISDGASSVMWETYANPLTNDGAATVGGSFNVPLPENGLVGTLGNSLVIALAAPGGSVVSKLNAEVRAA